MSKYKDDDIEDVDPLKKTKYKTWNKFFSNNYLIEVSYERESIWNQIARKGKENQVFWEYYSWFWFQIQ